MVKVKRRKKRRMKKKVIIIAIVLLLIIAATGGYLYYKSLNDDDGTIKVEDVDSIEGYDYTLSSTATKYYKSLFKELKAVLEADEVDYDEYADLVTKLFVADFYNLDNKINKNDVGGLQFVYEDYQEDFTSLATTSMYKNVENNLYGDRDQDLPVVSNVSVTMNESESFSYGDETDDEAYVIDFEITYEEDLGYQTTGTITLIHSNDKLEVAALES